MKENIGHSSARYIRTWVNIRGERPGFQNILQEGGVRELSGVKFKALSVVRPGGSLIASGKKTLEIRRWKPDLAPSEDLLIIENCRQLTEVDDEMMDGIAVAIVNIELVRNFEQADIAAACAAYFEDGWLAWELTNVRPIRLEIELRAARKIYQVELPAAGLDEQWVRDMNRAAQEAER